MASYLGSIDFWLCKDFFKKLRTMPQTELPVSGKDRVDSRQKQKIYFQTENVTDTSYLHMRTVQTKDQNPKRQGKGYDSLSEMWI
jgi:hypothetical protein